MPNWSGGSREVGFSGAGGNWIDHGDDPYYRSYNGVEPPPEFLTKSGWPKSLRKPPMRCSKCEHGANKEKGKGSFAGYVLYICHYCKQIVEMCKGKQVVEIGANRLWKERKRGHRYCRKRGKKGMRNKQGLRGTSSGHRSSAPKLASERQKRPLPRTGNPEAYIIDMGGKKYKCGKEVPCDWVRKMSESRYYWSAISDNTKGAKIDHACEQCLRDYICRMDFYKNYDARGNPWL